MRNNMRTFILILFVLPLSLHAQTKKELMDQVDQQKSTIDSLQKVIANFENIVENRDRSINILKEDRNTLGQEILDFQALVRAQRVDIAKLKKQTEIGTAKVIQLDNKIARLKVKEGKIWTINQIICDYTTGVTVDSLGNPVIEEVHIFFKSINGEMLTDISQNKFGPQIYSSLHPEHSLRFPITFSAGESFGIQIFKGPLNNLKPLDAKVICSYTEKDI